MPKFLRIPIMLLFAAALALGWGGAPTTSSASQTIPPAPEAPPFGNQDQAQSPPQGVFPGGPPMGAGMAQAQVKQLKTDYLAKIEITGAARPEIIASGDKVFVIYLDVQKRSYMARVYDRNLAGPVGEAVLAVPTIGYGRPTDMRAAAALDGKSYYVFFESADEAANKAYLFGARFALNDRLSVLAATPGPIVTSSFHYRAQDGEELLDDPEPVPTRNAIYVITRLKSPPGPDGKAVLRVRELSPDLQILRRVFDLDLSKYVSGGARQGSVIAKGGRYFLAIPTTTGQGPAPIDNATPSDLALVELDADWKPVSSKIIRAEHGDTGTNVSGFATDGKRYYLTYRRIAQTPAPLSGAESMLTVLDSDFRPARAEPLDATPLGRGPQLIPRPTVAVSGDRVYTGSEGPGMVRIFAFPNPLGKK